MPNNYASGWNAGARGRWPEHKPPLPPHPIIKCVIETASALRDEVDALCATISEDDPWTQKLGPKVDSFDDALVGLTNWLKGRDEQI